MGIFSSIKGAIFGDDDDKGATPTAAATAAAGAAKAASEERASISGVDVVARIGNIPGSDKLNWQNSIVDLMKLVQIDPSYENRKELAGELGNTGYSGTAEDNIALHKAVMKGIADAGGIVPDSMKD